MADSFYDYLASNDLLKDIGKDDQLTALREENARLRELCGEGHDALLDLAPITREVKYDYYPLMKKLEAASKGE